MAKIPRQKLPRSVRYPGREPRAKAKLFLNWWRFNFRTCVPWVEILNAPEMVAATTRLYWTVDRAWSCTDCFYQFFTGLKRLVSDWGHWSVPPALYCLYISLPITPAPLVCLLSSFPSELSKKIFRGSFLIRLMVAAEIFCGLPESTYFFRPTLCQHYFLNWKSGSSVVIEILGLWKKIYGPFIHCANKNEESYLLRLYTVAASVRLFFNYEVYLNIIKSRLRGKSRSFRSSSRS